MVVCSWVITELEFIEKHECARCLEGYWLEGDIGVLAQILEYAQFPEQMSE